MKILYDKKPQELLELFGYSGEALESFIEKINEGPAEDYGFIKDNGRLIKKIGIEEREALDEGWKLFNEAFLNFVKDYKITYGDFISNSFVFNKQSKKLFKTVISEYKKSETVSEILDEVSSRSLPKGRDIYLVLSINHSDFLLCSTRNPWTSCLDLEGGEYWPSLSGFLLDKNRSMIYLTDLVEKEYFGIKSFKMFNRMWCLLDKSGKINANINYPKKDRPPIEILSKVFDLEIKQLTDGFVSKYEISPIYNNNNVFVFGYQDNTKLEKKGSSFVIKSDNKTRCSIISKSFFGKVEQKEYNELYEMFKDETLETLLEKNRNFSDFLYYMCETCEERKSNVLLINGEVICKDCFDNNKLVCGECGHKYKRKFITVDNSIICSDCKKEENYIKCKKCNKYFIGTNEELCDDCSQENKSVFKCDCCNEYKDRRYKNILSETLFLPYKRKTFVPLNHSGVVCGKCLDDIINESNISYCDNCGQYYENNEENKCCLCGDTKI